MSSNRHVRLGIVYRGNIIHESILDRRVDVSVGQRATSTVQFLPRDYPEFPEFLDVLIIDQGQYYLVVPDDPKARINLRGGPKEKQTVEIRGKRCIPVEKMAGGSLVVGDVSVMFQFVRGDSTPTVTHERTVLRIGLVFNDRLISDRIFPEEKVIRVGPTKEDSLVLDSADYTGAGVSFTNNKDGSVTFKAPKAMKMKIAQEGAAPLDITELTKAGKAQIEGEEVVAHLALGTRGRISMGDYTVLFQVIRQRIVVPSMEKQGFVKGIISAIIADSVYTTSLAIVFLAAFGVVGQALIFNHTTGKYLDKAKQEEKLANQTYEVVIEEQEEPEPEEPEEEPEEVVDVKPVEEEAKPAKEEAKPEKEEPKAKEPAKEEKPQSVGEEKDPAERKRVAREVIAKKTIAGAFNGAAASKLFGEAEEGEAGDVVAKTFGGGGDEAGDAGPGGGVEIAAGGGGGTVEKVKTGKRKGFKRSDKATKVATKKKTEKKISIKLNSGTLGGSGPAKTEIAKVIRRKNRAIQRCYEAALRDNPNVGGKVGVSFVVGTAGTVTTVRVSGATGGFKSCIESKFKRIRGLPQLPAPQTFNQSYVFSKG
jgi:outer membrane biosynthesis protein TonB